MSGHSKWHNIQGKKGKADKARSNTFTKLSRAISLAAQQGGGDSEMNFSLRLAVEKARIANMPKDNIEKAIKRGTGELKDEAVLQEVVYEGFGPGGIAFLVEAVTDNNNRTFGDVKNAFSKNGGNLGSPGSVQWQFSHLGVIIVAKEKLIEKNIIEDEFSLKLIEIGAEDIIESEYGLEIRCELEKFKTVLDAVIASGLEPEDSGLEWVAKETVELDEEVKTKVEKLYEIIEELDDVKNVYTNES